MPLIKNGQPAEDHWIFLNDEDPLPAEGDVVVSLGRWRTDRENLGKRKSLVGVRLEADETAEGIGADAPQFALIALTFPKFNDGRAFSTARLIRERYGYQGELRATGHILRDQYLFMARCGFDAFEVEDTADLGAWADALEEISVFYQPAVDEREPVYRQRLSYRQIPEAG